MVLPPATTLRRPSSPPLGPPGPSASSLNGTYVAPGEGRERLFRLSAMPAGERYQVIVHVDHDALPEDGTGLRSHLEGGPRVSAETSRRLSCDCSVVRVHEGVDGEILKAALSACGKHLERARDVADGPIATIVRPPGSGGGGCAGIRFRPHQLQAVGRTAMPSRCRTCS